MNAARVNAYTCVYDGKIYVMGGVKDEESSYAEVFDIEAQTWECLPDPCNEIRKCYIHKLTEVEGTINFGYGSKKYGYEIKLGKWKCYPKQRVVYARIDCMPECVMNNLYYSFWNRDGWNAFMWRGMIRGGHFNVKGLDAVGEKYMRNGGSSCNTTKLASCDGKLLLMWEGYTKHNPRNRKKIWCAEISIEKRDEYKHWGNVEWLDVVHTVTVSCQLLHCIAVSL